ncbi:MAG: CoA transferase [Acidimicrobiales bacterium]
MTEQRTMPLEGVRVVELATGISGPFAGRFLADAGADVIKVEPPGGDPARTEGPFPGDVADPERSGAFLYLNTNKRALVARADDPADRALLATLLDGAALLIEGEGDASAAAWGLGDDELRARWPRLCRLQVSGFGPDGPYAGWRSSELVAFAMGGPMASMGLEGREPHKMAGNVVQMQCGNMAALAGLAALTVAERSGRGITVDVANFHTQAGSIDRRVPYLIWHLFTGGRPVPYQGGHRAGLIPGGVYPTEDGYVQVLAAPGWLTRLAELIGDEEVIRRFAQPDWMDDDELPLLLDGALHVWTLTRGRYEAQSQAQAEGLGVMALNTPVELLEDPHFRARDYWRTIEHPVAGRYTLPGPPFRLRGAWALRRPAPTLDQHGAELRAEVRAAAGRTAANDQEPAATGQAPARLPPDGCGCSTHARRAPTPLRCSHRRRGHPRRQPKFFPTATWVWVVRPRPGKAAEAGPASGARPERRSRRAAVEPCRRLCRPRPLQAGRDLDLRSGLGRRTFPRLWNAKRDVLVENNWPRSSMRSASAGTCCTPATRFRSWCGCRRSASRDRTPTTSASWAHVEALTGFTSLRGYTDLDLSANGTTYHGPGIKHCRRLLPPCRALRRREHRRGRADRVRPGRETSSTTSATTVEASLSGVARERLGNRHVALASLGRVPLRRRQPVGGHHRGR